MAELSPHQLRDTPSFAPSDYGNTFSDEGTIRHISSRFMAQVPPALSSRCRLLYAFRVHIFRRDRCQVGGLGSSHTAAAPSPLPLNFASYAGSQMTYLVFATTSHSVFACLQWTYEKILALEGVLRQSLTDVESQILESRLPITVEVNAEGEETSVAHRRPS